MAPMMPQTGGLNHQELRSKRRFPLTLNLKFNVTLNHKKMTGLGRTVNVSSAGILFWTQERINVGKPIQLSVAWPLDLDGKIGLRLWVSGKVVRTEGNFVGVTFWRHEFRTTSTQSVLTTVNR